MRLLDLCFTSVEYIEVIKDYTESQLDMGQIASILINLKHHLDDDNAILILFEL